MLVLGVLALPVWADEPKIEWVTTKANKGQTEVKFPGKPVDNSKPNAEQFVLEAEGGKVAFLMMSNVLPKEADIKDKDIIAKLFDGGKDGLIKAFKNSKIIAERNVTFAGKYPSKEVDLEIPDLGIYRTKWIATPTTFVQLVVLGPKDYVEGVTASLFFDSLKITAGK
jgi:hypothetical protein